MPVVRLTTSNVSCRFAPTDRDSAPAPSLEMTVRSVIDAIGAARAAATFGRTSTTSWARAASPYCSNAAASAVRAAPSAAPRDRIASASAEPSSRVASAPAVLRASSACAARSAARPPASAPRSTRTASAVAARSTRPPSASAVSVTRSASAWAAAIPACFCASDRKMAAFRSPCATCSAS